MPGQLDLNHILVTLVASASLLSLLLLLLKALGKEFESVAVLWLRVLRRIKAEKNKSRLCRDPQSHPD